MENSQELARIREHNEAFCSMLLGSIKAMEYTLRTIITVHHAPATLHAAWQALLPEIVDTHLDSGAPDHSMFHAGLQTILQSMTDQIQLAVRQPPGQQDASG